MTQTPIPSKEGRVCKFCRMGIDPKAIVCPHCQHRLTKSTWFIWLVLGLVLSLCVGGFMLANEMNKDREQSLQRVNKDTSDLKAELQDIKAAKEGR
jgi:hypothetical protein